jgi:serine/threonine protein kinase
MKPEQTTLSRKLEPGLSSTNSVPATKEPFISHFVDGNLKVVKTICNSRFPVFIAYSPHSNKYFALKVFAYENDEVSACFINESRFKHISHPNVISIVETNENQKTSYKGKYFRTSYLLMDLACCDFTDFITRFKLSRDEILFRTYFHQLIQGLEHLHSNGVSHMDLKTENLLLTEDFMLKITDFDLAYKKGDLAVRGQGSINFRAPEVKALACTNPEKADVYSSGIILFTLRTGYLPYFEDESLYGYDLFDLMLNNVDSFWIAHRIIGRSVGKFSDEFKKLFISMTKKEPEQRASIQEIKESDWYRGPTYTQEELQGVVSQFIEEKKAKLNA